MEIKIGTANEGHKSTGKLLIHSSLPTTPLHVQSTPCKHPVILLQDVNFNDLHSLVEFIYHGEVNVHQKSLQSFLKTAEVLRVSGLTQQQAEDTHSVSSGQNARDVASTYAHPPQHLQHLAQIQNLANAGGRAPHSSHPHHAAMGHDEGAATLFRSRPGAGASPPPPPPPQLQQINNEVLKRMAMLHRSNAEETHALKRMRSVDGNGLPSSNNNNSPDLQLHARSASPQVTPADFSTIKHHNNNNTPPLKEEKRKWQQVTLDHSFLMISSAFSLSLFRTGNGPTGNGSAGNSGNGNANGNNGISISEKLGSLTPSPLARGVEDVKSEPMELVCSNNNNANANANDEHSNDSTGEHDANRSSSGDGGKGSLRYIILPPAHFPLLTFSLTCSSGNDDEIGDNLASHHATQPYIMSPADNKLFSGAFNFPISNLEHSALLGAYSSGKMRRYSMLLILPSSDACQVPVQGCQPARFTSGRHRMRYRCICSLSTVREGPP